MSEKYIPLYRKYRPQTLAEVVGQTHIKKALTNAIILNKISHAYLFTGPRGTGKTSTARILAKSLNCVNGPTITPCGKCPSCMEITNATPVDVIEIDAASNRTVEDAQNILEKVQYAPVNGKYRIYIIDEVHMLSKTAFNALLKTLEEPPQNVIFILATTEPQKVLDTIKSRCQRFDFRRITTDDIVEHLKKIAKKEKIKIEDEAIVTIAKSAAGGMRDSLALLDQVSVLDNTKAITSDDVNSLLGRLSFDVLFKLSEQIINSKPQDALENLDKIYNAGNEPTQILTNLLNYFKNMLIVKNCANKDLLEELTQFSPSQIDNLKNQADKLETHQIVFLTERTSYYIKEVKLANNQHLWLEVGIIDLSNLAENTSLIDLQERLSKLEAGGVSIAPMQRTYAPRPAVVADKAPTKKEINSKSEEKIQPQKETKIEDKKAILKEFKNEAPTAPAPLQNDVAEVKSMPVKETPSVASGDLVENWKKFISCISSPPAVALLTDYAKPVEMTPEKIVIACEKEFSLKALTTESKKKTLTEAAKKTFGVDDISLLVRLQHPGDEEIIKNSFSNSFEKKNDLKVSNTSNTNPKTGVVPKKDTEQNETDEIDPDIEEEIEVKMKKDKPDKQEFLSDQVSMVIKLFDGKYIE